LILKQCAPIDKQWFADKFSFASTPSNKYNVYSYAEFFLSTRGHGYGFKRITRCGLRTMFMSAALIFFCMTWPASAGVIIFYTDFSSWQANASADAPCSDTDGFRSGGRGMFARRQQ
jgi:hypothetical protein